MCAVARAANYSGVLTDADHICQSCHWPSNRTPAITALGDGCRRAVRDAARDAAVLSCAARHSLAHRGTGNSVAFAADCRHVTEGLALSPHMCSNT